MRGPRPRTPSTRRPRGPDDRPRRRAGPAVGLRGPAACSLARAASLYAGVGAEVLSRRDLEPRRACSPSVGRRLSCCEINNPFYRHPQPKRRSPAGWAATPGRVPVRGQGPARWQHAGPSWPILSGTVEVAQRADTAHFGDKLGCVLFRVPGRKIPRATTSGLSGPCSRPGPRTLPPLTLGRTATRSWAVDEVFDLCCGGSRRSHRCATKSSTRTPAPPHASGHDRCSWLFIPACAAEDVFTRPTWRPRRKSRLVPFLDAGRGRLHRVPPRRRRDVTAPGPAPRGTGRHDELRRKPDSVAFPRGQGPGEGAGVARRTGVPRTGGRTNLGQAREPSAGPNARG